MTHKTLSGGGQPVLDDVARAIMRAWDKFGEVPFPLYRREAEKLAEAAIAAIRPEPAP